MKNDHTDKVNSDKRRTSASMDPALKRLTSHESRGPSYTIRTKVTKLYIKSRSPPKKKRRSRAIKAINGHLHKILALNFKNEHWWCRSPLHLGWEIFNIHYVLLFQVSMFNFIDVEIG